MYVFFIGCVLHVVFVMWAVLHVGGYSCGCSSCGSCSCWPFFMSMVMVLSFCMCVICVPLFSCGCKFIVLRPGVVSIVIVRTSAFCQVIYLSVSMSLGVYVHAHGIHKRENHVNKIYIYIKTMFSWKM